MNIKNPRQLFSHTMQAGKWILVIWLIWPVQNALTNRIDFTRVLLGILLFIIFAGKLFYDTLLQGQLQNKGKASYGIWDIIGLAVGLAILVGAMVLFLALLALFFVKNSMSVESL